jgi:S1-C subfamily serine protease
MTDVSNSFDVLGALSNQMADAVERAAAATVLVNGRQRHPASGIVYAADSILTADHVLEREEELSVQTPDGRTLAAQFVGRDPATDLALLRVADLGLAPITAAQGDARVGQIVLAVGRPLGDGPMASVGVVSAIGGPLRTSRGGMLERYIRTDATPYPGFSGGPLADAQGHALGVLTTGVANGVALAVPAALAWRIAEAIAQNGSVKRGFMGISSQPVQLPEGQRAGRPQESGLLVVRVEDDSPASRGGLLLGDIVVGLDGQAVADTDELQSLLTGDRVGKAVPVEVIRGGALHTLQVVIGQRG